MRQVEQVNPVFVVRDAELIATEVGLNGDILFLLRVYQVKPQISTLRNCKRSWTKSAERIFFVSRLQRFSQ